jgi:hypothetical protein
VKAHNTPIPKGLAVLQGLPVLAVVFLRDAPCRVGMKRVGNYKKRKGFSFLLNLRGHRSPHHKRGRSDVVLNLKENKRK